MATLGFRPYLKAEVQAPIIVTFHAPADPAYQFKSFYAAVRDRGYILYPGKLTAGGDLPCRLHRRDRCQRDAQCRLGGGHGAEGPRAEVRGAADAAGGLMAAP